MNRIYYLGKPADGFGWGVANTNLVKALGEFCEVVVDDSSRTKFDAPVFVPISDSALNPLRRIKRAPRILGYGFTEWPILPAAKWNAKLYSVIFTGSTWNTQRLAEHGIASVPLIQGVDFSRFTVQPPSERAGFCVFSGGKFEFRKGQDFVIAAMRIFMNVRKDVTLLTAWHNPWPESAASMSASWLIDVKNPFEGLPDRVIHLPPVPNDKTPAIYTQAHVGLFPNRCEAGTNLVMCEFMACARPVIASYAHGHRDVLEGSKALLLKKGAYDPAGWFNPELSDMVAHLEWAYTNRDELASIGLACRQAIAVRSWRACAKQIFDAAFPQPLGRDVQPQDRVTTEPPAVDL